MFIRRKEFDALVARVETLERSAKYDDSREFTVYEPVTSPIQYQYLELMNKQKISVKSAIERIMAHLGLEMKYVAGTPAKVEFVKEKKAKGAA